jgi:hypothetical protein
MASLFFYLTQAESDLQTTRSSILGALGARSLSHSFEAAVPGNKERQFLCKFHRCQNVYGVGS